MKSIEEPWKASLCSGREREVLAEQIEMGTSDVVAGELARWQARARSGLSKAQAQHANMLSAYGVTTVRRGAGHRLDEASAYEGLKHLYSIVRQSLETQSVKAAGKTLDEVVAGDEAQELELHDQCFTTAVGMLLATARLGDDTGNASIPAAPYAPYGRLVDSVPRRALGVAAALKSRGFLVIDGALPPEQVAALKRDLQIAYERRDLKRPDQQRVSGTRGDSYGWFGEAAADSAGQKALASTIRSLKAIAHHLNAVSYHERPLHVDENAIGTRYPGAVDADHAPYRGYRRHQDNHRDLNVGASTNARHLTAILYANPDWDVDADGGVLKIYPGTAHQDELKTSDLPGAVDVAPKGGRLVIFDSYLWHEVLPARIPRFACTQWITDPAVPRV